MRGCWKVGVGFSWRILGLEGHALRQQPIQVGYFFLHRKTALHNTRDTVCSFAIDFFVKSWDPLDGDRLWIKTSQIRRRNF